MLIEGAGFSADRVHLARSKAAAGTPIPETTSEDRFVASLPERREALLSDALHMLPGTSREEREQSLALLESTLGADGPTPDVKPRRKSVREFVGLYAGREPDPQRTTRFGALLSVLHKENQTMDGSKTAAIFLYGQSRSGTHLTLPEMVGHFARLRAAADRMERRALSVDARDDFVLEAMHEVMRCNSYQPGDLPRLEQAVQSMGDVWLGGIVARESQKFEPEVRPAALDAMLSLLQPAPRGMSGYSRAQEVAHMVGTCLSLRRPGEDLTALSREFQSQVEGLRGFWAERGQEKRDWDLTWDLGRIGKSREPEETLTQALQRYCRFGSRLLESGLPPASLNGIYEATWLEALSRRTSDPATPLPGSPGDQALDDYVAGQSYKVHPHWVATRASTREALARVHAADLFERGTPVIDALPLGRREAAFSALAGVGSCSEASDFFEGVPRYQQLLAGDAEADFRARLEELVTLRREFQAAGVRKPQELNLKLAELREGESFLPLGRAYLELLARAPKTAPSVLDWAWEHRSELTPGLSLAELTRGLATCDPTVLEPRALGRAAERRDGLPFLESVQRLAGFRAAPGWSAERLDQLHDWAWANRERLRPSFPGQDFSTLAAGVARSAADFFDSEELSRELNHALEHPGGLTPARALEAFGALRQELLDLVQRDRAYGRPSVLAQVWTSLAASRQGQELTDTVKRLAPLVLEHVSVDNSTVLGRVQRLVERGGDLEQGAARMGSSLKSLEGAGLDPRRAELLEDKLWKELGPERYGESHPVLVEAARHWAERKLPAAELEAYLELSRYRPPQQLAEHRWITGMLQPVPALLEKISNNYPDRVEEVYAACLERMRLAREQGATPEQAIQAEQTRMEVQAMATGPQVRSGLALEEGGAKVGGVFLRRRAPSG